MQSRPYFIVIFILFLSQYTFSQKVTLNGKITDSLSNESLIGATIYIEELSKGAITNEYGFYALTLPVGNYTINYDYLGYKTKVINITIDSDSTQNITLFTISKNLSEVVIDNVKRQISIKKPEMSVNKLSSKSIKELPVVLGEVDVVKALLQLPGVTNAGESSAGFNVRGGTTDQNLILLDEATLFSSSHLFGLFSIFNPDAIKDLKLYKGGIPARYGGRISSVLDIYQREGNSKEFHVEGGIGLVSSRMLVEGPIIKDKTSFLAAGRSSYAHLFLPLLDINNSAYFYDLNLKVNHTINDNNSLFLSSYFGRDIFSIEDLFLNEYGNSFLNLRWNHLFNTKLFSNTSLIYSNYDYKLDLDFIGFTWNSGIDNYNFKYDLVHYLNDNITLRYGTNHLFYDFNPGKIAPNSNESSIIEKQLIKKKAYESGYYTEAEVNLNKQLTLNAGLRLSTFLRFGQPNISRYLNNEAVIYDTNLGIYKEAEEIETFSISRNKVWKDFYNLEPRFSMSYSFNEHTSIKTSYQRTTQYIHLISNTSSPTPLDIWTPSGNFIKPQFSNQYAFGYFKTLNDNTYSISAEVYFKDIKNRVNYIDGADIIANETIERVLLNGKGRTYGFEFLLQKTKGNFKGWLAYTLSRAEQQIKGRTPIEPGINNGKWFVTNYNKTHDISINASYRFSNKWKGSSSFSFQSGIPTTYPTGQYTLQSLGGLVVPDFGERNSNQLPSYHRLDISLNYIPKPNSEKKWKSEWVFGIYNLYNRKNANSISFNQNDETKQNEATQLSIFGIIPSITYNFKF